LYKPLEIKTLNLAGVEESLKAMRLPMEGRKNISTDYELASKLIKMGPAHAKFTRGIIVWAEIFFQVGWMIEMETYRIGVDTLSTSSSMHTDLRNLDGIELAEQKQKDLPEKYYHRISVFLIKY